MVISYLLQRSHLLQGIQIAGLVHLIQDVDRNRYKGQKGENPSKHFSADRIVVVVPVFRFGIIRPGKYQYALKVKLVNSR